MMERGLGWWYPAGADGPDAPWNEQDHDARCQLSDDYEWSDDEDPDDAECTCAELAADAKSDAAQAKIDAWKERTAGQ